MKTIGNKLRPCHHGVAECGLQHFWLNRKLRRIPGASARTSAPDVRVQSLGLRVQSLRVLGLGCAASQRVHELGPGRPSLQV